MTPSAPAAPATRVARLCRACWDRRWGSRRIPSSSSRPGSSTRLVYTRDRRRSLFLFPGPKPPDDLLECPDQAAGAEVPGCTDHLQVAIGMEPQNFPDYLFLSYSVRFKRWFMYLGEKKLFDTLRLFIFCIFSLKQWTVSDENVWLVLITSTH